MVAARRENSEAGQEIGVRVAVGVVQVRALGPLVDLVEADRVQHFGLLRVQVPAVQLISVVAMGREQSREVEVDGSFSPYRGRSFRFLIFRTDTGVSFAGPVQLARAGEEAGPPAQVHDAKDEW